MPLLPFPYLRFALAFGGRIFATMRHWLHALPHKLDAKVEPDISTRVGSQDTDAQDTTRLDVGVEGSGHIGALDFISRSTLVGRDRDGSVLGIGIPLVAIVGGRYEQVKGGSAARGFGSQPKVGNLRSSAYHVLRHLDGSEGDLILRIHRRTTEVTR